MLIGVISDTHGCVEPTRRAVRFFESFGVAAVLHCGDVGLVEIVSLFAPWEAHFVFGNTDNPLLLRTAVEEAGQTCHGEFGSIELGVRRVALTHGHDHAIFERALAAEEYDLLCYGHTHVAACDRTKNGILLNPGAIHRGSPPSVAVVDLADMVVHPLTL